MADHITHNKATRHATQWNGNFNSHSNRLHRPFSNHLNIIQVDSLRLSELPSSQNTGESDPNSVNAFVLHDTEIKEKSLIYNNPLRSTQTSRILQQNSKISKGKWICIAIIFIVVILGGAMATVLYFEVIRQLHNASKRGVTPSFVCDPQSSFVSPRQFRTTRPCICQRFCVFETPTPMLTPTPDTSNYPFSIPTPSTLSFLSVTMLKPFGTSLFTSKDDSPTTSPLVSSLTRHALPAPTSFITNIASLHPTAPVTANTCLRWYTVVKTDTCFEIDAMFSISFDDLKFMNPHINDLCTNLIIGGKICIQSIT